MARVVDYRRPPPPMDWGAERGGKSIFPARRRVVRLERRLRAMREAIRYWYGEEAARHIEAYAAGQDIEQ